MSRRQWNREEQLLALRLYCILPFGKLHQSNWNVIATAEAIDRTPSAVAMKACNFASLDPVLERRGLGNVSRADSELWHEFHLDSETIAAEAESIYNERVKPDLTSEEIQTTAIPEGETERVLEVRTRRVQGFFRKSVLVSYGYQCAISGLKLPELIIASHIIPWSVDEKRRADPTNGIALNALYDRSFDKGLISFDDDYRVIASDRLKREIAMREEVRDLFQVEGKALRLPGRFRPDLTAIRYHREHVFTP